MKTKRKPIPQKIRFEVFKRDGFRCAYCGKEPPAVVLEVDHIEPISKGGVNNINNYITACFDCNRGKAGTPLDKIPSTLVDNLHVLKEKEAQLLEFRKYIKKIEKRENKDIQDIDDLFHSFHENHSLNQSFAQTSLRHFLKNLPKHEVEEAMRLAVAKIHNRPDACIKYFCGICWNKIKGAKNER